MPPLPYLTGLDAVLYTFLAAGAAARAFRGHQQRKAAALLLLLIFYAAVRAVTQMLLATGTVTQNQQYTENLLNSVPATLYSMLQTALVWRWVRSVAEVKMVLSAEMFTTGDVVRFSSLGLAVLQPLLVVLGMMDVLWLHFSSLTPNDWNLLLSLYSGFLFIYNGLAFLGLGLLLLGMWGQPEPWDQEGRLNRWRILMIAAVFSTMTFVRGLGLVLYLFKASSHDVSHVVSSTWGSALLFLGEWLSIVMCVFVIPSFRTRKVDSAAEQYVTFSENNSMTANRGFAAAINASTSPTNASASGQKMW